MEHTGALRRARTLIVYWHGGDLVVENYLAARSTDADTDNAYVVDELTIRLLDRFDDWTDPDLVAKDFDGYEPESVRAAIDQLAAAGLLCTREAAAAEEELERTWAHWSQEARYFHFGTKDACYIGDDEQHRRATLELVTASGPPPQIFKTYPQAPRVYLPRAFQPLRADFGDVLRRRRTHRTFTGEPVPLTTLSTVLHHTFGPMHFVDAGPLGTLMLRTSPGGGARHELECYVGVLDVQGLDPGLYHYCAENHSLELLDPRFDAARLDRLAFGQRMATSAGFVCFVTAVFERAMYKYRHPRTYRMVLLDAGHLAQTFALTCTALGLGPFQTAAFRDSEVEAALGLDGFAEGALYLLGAGVPVDTVDGLPGELRPSGTPTRNGTAPRRSV